MNGWAPRSVTLAADGSVLSVTISEPRFTRADRALLLASRRADLAPRGAHGILLSEAMDPDNRAAFEVGNPSMDWAQKALNDAQDAYQKKYPDADLRARMWRVRKRS